MEAEELRFLVRKARKQQSFVNLPKTQLTDLTLQYLNLRSANLYQADLSRTSLTWASLQGADLRFANFAFADLSFSSLDGVKLFGANLECTDLYHCSLVRTDLSGVDLRRVRIEGLHAPTKTDFSGALLTDEQKAWLFMQKAKAS